jgi:hypothetical protein
MRASAYATTRARLTRQLLILAVGSSFLLAVAASNASSSPSRATGTISADPTYWITRVTNALGGMGMTDISCNQNANSLSCTAHWTVSVDITPDPTVTDPARATATLTIPVTEVSATAVEYKIFLPGHQGTWRLSRSAPFRYTLTSGGRVTLHGRGFLRILSNSPEKDQRLCSDEPGNVKKCRTPSGYTTANPDAIWNLPEKLFIEKQRLEMQLYIGQATKPVVTKWFNFSA